MAGSNKDDILGTLGTTATASPETATPAAKKRVRIVDTNERSVKKDKKEDRRRVRDGDSDGQRRKKHRGRDSRTQRSEKRLRQRLMSGSGSSEGEGGCAAETAAEICAESAGVCGRMQCRLKRVMCRDLQKRVVDLERQLDSSVQRTEELDRQVFELTDTAGYAQWMERREQWLRTVEVKRAGWLMERRKVHMERELWQIGRQLVQMEERLGSVCQQVADAEAKVGRERGVLDEMCTTQAVVQRSISEMTQQLEAMHGDAELVRAEARAAMVDESAAIRAQQEGLERDKKEVAAAWGVVLLDRRQELFAAGSVEIGSSGLQMLEIEASMQDAMRCKTMADGWRHFNVTSEAPMQYFRIGKEQGQWQTSDSKLVQLRRESRGLVLDAVGAVQVRPLQKFYKWWQLKGIEKTALMSVAVTEVTEKMDGEMMCGVVRQGQVELWSRGGWTEQARSATRWASTRRVGVLALVAEVWSKGGTATFEYIGRQSRVRVRYTSTDLVLVAVRDRQLGTWWQHADLMELGLHHSVTVVRRVVELEGLEQKQIEREVESWVGEEGVVVRLADGLVIKAKSFWWTQQEKKEKRRWYNQEHKRMAEHREEKRKVHMEREDQRVVLRGWNHWVHPSRALDWYAGAMKVEAVCRRSDGRQGTVVLSFRTAGAAKAALGCKRLDGSRVHAVRAYSSRTTPTEQCRVKTWWRYCKG
jgi:hypothetical protein